MNYSHLLIDIKLALSRLPVGWGKRWLCSATVNRRSHSLVQTVRRWAPGFAKSSWECSKALCKTLLSSHPFNRLKEAHAAGQGSLHFSMSYIAKSFYDLSAISLDGEKIDFNTFRGRAVLIENVASL